MSRSWEKFLTKLLFMGLAETKLAIEYMTVVSLEWGLYFSTEQEE